MFHYDIFFDMKTALNMTLVVSFLLFSSLGWTFVLPLDFVVKKTVAKTGRSAITIEQEVTFKSGNDTLKTMETWAVEGDKNLKVSMTSEDASKESLHVNSLFNSKLKTQITGKNKSSIPLPADFFEKYLFVRSSDSFYQYLRDLGIAEKTRLSRADGRICIAIGEASGPDTKNPEIWIDQDDFLIRKIRMPSGTEISFSDYARVNDDFWIAKTQVIKWAGAEATIKVKSFSTKNAPTLQSFYPQNFEQHTDITFSQSNTLSQVVDDFYKRFR